MSDVLIRGMEMPKSCRECRFDSAGRCLATDRIENRTRFVKFATYDSPQEWCPLVPVPPHGRLIDADKQDAQIEALIERHLHGYTKSTWDFICELRDTLKRNPTVIQKDSAEEEKNDK